MKKKENEIMLQEKNNDPVNQLATMLMDRMNKEIMEPIEDIREDVNDLDERMDKVEAGTTIESREQGEIQRCVSMHIHELLADESPKNWKKYAHTFFFRCYGSLKHRFCVPSYRDIRKVDFELARDIINEWEPYGGVQALKDEIDEREAE